jgi:hypothetical protein
MRKIAAQEDQCTGAKALDGIADETVPAAPGDIYQLQLRMVMPKVEEVRCPHVLEGDGFEVVFAVSFEELRFHTSRIASILS